MSIGYADKEELINHWGHDIEMVLYGSVDCPASVTIECSNCKEVLIDTAEREDYYDGENHLTIGQ